MSDVAAIGSLDGTIGLMPRYLRNRDADGASTLNADQKPEPPAKEPNAADELSKLPGMRGTSLTEELRRRIGEVATPEKHGFPRLWFGVAAVAVIAVVCLLFPDVIAAILPGADGSL
jgi:hypothetical protein